MNALILNGSPKKNGTVATLLRAVGESLGSGTQVEWIDAYRTSVHPCMACMKCRERGECVLPIDDGHRIGARIAQADILIVGTPTHWGNMSTPLKGLLDRNVPVFMGEDHRSMPLPRQKGKPAVIVTACSTPWPFDRIMRESRGAIAAVKEVLHYGGYRLVGTLVKPGSRKKPDIEPRLLRRATRLGARLESIAARKARAEAQNSLPAEGVGAV